MTRITATAEVSAIGQIELNSSNRLLASSFNMLTVAKFVRTSVATAADTIGGPTLREYLKESRLPRATEEIPPYRLINCALSRAVRRLIPERADGFRPTFRGPNSGPAEGRLCAKPDGGDASRAVAVILGQLPDADPQRDNDQRRNEV